MGLRERIEEEVRAALRATGATRGSRINVTSRVNRVIVRNVGGGDSAASAEQSAPIIQEPPAKPGEQPSG
jgi:hypothetical protein